MPSLKEVTFHREDGVLPEGAKPPLRWRLQRLVGPLLLGAVVLVTVGVGVLLAMDLLGEDPADASELDLAAEVLAAQSDAQQAQSGRVQNPGGVTTTEPSSGATLTLLDIPAGAAVRVDDEPVGRAPLPPLDVAPGYRFVSVEAGDQLVMDTLVYAAEGGTLSLSMEPADAVVASALLEPYEAPRQREVTAQPEPRRPEPRPAEPAPRTPAQPRVERPRAEPPAVRPAQGALVVQSEPSGAEVLIDGQARGTTPLSLSGLPVGTYTVSLSAPDHVPVQRSVAVQAGATETVRLTLAPAAPPQGRLVVVARPWGSVYIDGALHARNTDVAYETELLAGPHRVRVVHPDLGTREVTVDVGATVTTRVTIDLTQPPD